MFYSKPGGPIEYNVIRHIARETLQGLKYMHSLDIVHLDIKSVNVLMHHGTIKIGDFGSASSLPVGNEVKGTLYWMAPELIFTYWDSQFYTKKCDVWSFGVMLLGGWKLQYKWHTFLYLICILWTFIRNAGRRCALRQS